VAAPPFVLGHESAGHVTAIGPKVRNFKVGDLVVRPWWFSGNGDRHGGLGSAWGGFAAWGIVRDSRAIASDTGKSDVWWDSSLVLPEMPVEHATMFVTWRDAMSCLMQMKVAAGQRVAVFGSGGNGMAFTRFATLIGAHVVMVGNPSRKDLATRLGARAFIDYRDGASVPDKVRDALGDRAGADFVIEAVGRSDQVPEMLRSLRTGGQLFLFGIPGDMKYPVNLLDAPGICTISRKMCEEWHSHEIVLKHYLAGEIRFEDFCDDVVPMDQIAPAFERIRSRKAMKIAVRLPH
jgi:L-iditol 2-dehydrogenase